MLLKNKIKFLIFGAVLLCIAAGCGKSTPAAQPTPSPTPLPQYNYIHKLEIGSQTLMVEIVNTPASEQQGLSGRSSMDNNNGMLFDFGSTASFAPAFWMKDMNFALDFIWIYQNKIVGVTPDVPKPVNCQPASPDTSQDGSLNVNCLSLYYPPSPVNQVLEVNAGWAKKNNIKVGGQTNTLN
jgi:uncharacterized membrane protein (UPF0127 family)